jgi:hypothetical protein
LFCAGVTALQEIAEEAEDVDAEISA